MNKRPLILICLLVLLSGGAAFWFTGQGSAPAPADPTPAPAPEATPAAAPSPAPAAPPVLQLIVPVGPDGNAIPQRSGALRGVPAAPAPAPARMEAVFRPSADQNSIILARGPSPGKGPVKLEPIGPGTHTIPPAGGKTGYGAGPGGGQSSGTSDGAMIWQPDGSFDSYDKDGHMHLEPTAPDGSRTGWFEDKAGNREEYKIGPDGSFSTRHPDGTVETVDKDGNRTIDLDGLMPTTTGPGGAGDDGAGAGPGGKPSAGIGEPHFLTADGTAYSTQSVGEFVYATGIPDQELQLRIAPYRDSRAVSAISGFAIRAGGAVIQILLDGTVRIDGKLAERHGETARYDLPEGGALGLWSDQGRLAHAVLIWPDLSTLWIDFHPGFLNFSVKWRRADPRRLGLSGLDDGDVANDLTARDGRITAAAPFVDSWRVSDAESLFSYEDHQSTADFSDPGFPYETASETHGALAESLCAGLKQDFTHTACHFDVGVTGEAAFATAAAAMDAQLTLDAPPAAGATATAPAGACFRAGDDMTAATAPDGDAVNVTTTGDSPAIFRFTTPGGIIIQTRLDTANSGPWTAGQPGYCVFDASGATVIPPTHSGTDSYFSRADQAQIPGGTYYLRVWGEGETHLTIAHSP